MNERVVTRFDMDEDETDRPSHLDRIKRHLDALESRGFFGKVTLNYHGGKIRTLEMVEVLKPEKDLK